MKYIVVVLLLVLNPYFSVEQVDRLRMDTDMFQCLNQGKYDSVSVLANNVLKESDKLEEDTSVYKMNAYTVLGIIHKNKGFYVSAIDFNLKLLAIAEKVKDSARMSVAYNNIGELYKFQNNIDQAILYFNKSLELEMSLKNDVQRSIRLYNLGESYKQLDSFDIALSYFNNSLILEKRNSNIVGVNYAMLGLVDIYLEINQMTEAKRFLDKVNKDKLNDDYDLKRLYDFLLLKYYIKSKATNESKSLLNEIQRSKNGTVDLIFDINLLKLEIELHKNSSEWHLMSEKYQELINLSEKYQSSEIQNRMNDLIYFNELKKKDIEIELIENQKVTIEKLKAFTNKLSIFLLLVLIFTVGYVVYNLKKK